MEHTAADRVLDLRDTPASRVPSSHVVWVDADQFTAMLAPPPTAPSGRLWLGARVGMALLLATNALYAFVSPEDFENIVRANPIGSRLSGLVVAATVVVAGANDAALAALVLAKRWRPWVWSWLGAWFAIIAATKLLNLLT